MVEQIFWIDLATKLEHHKFSLSFLQDYYTQINRLTFFGIGRLWALGASKKLLIRMSLGVIVQHYDSFYPYEFNFTKSQQEETEFFESLESKLKAGNMAVGRKNRATALLPFRLVKEPTKNRPIVFCFPSNMVSNPPKFTMVKPTDSLSLTKGEQCATVDLRGVFDHIPIAETCICAQAIHLKHKNQTYFFLGGLQGQSSTPHTHEHTLGEGLDICTSHVTFNSRYMDDQILGIDLHNIQKLRFSFENINACYIAISEKLDYNLSHVSEFLGTLHDTKTHTFLPSEKHYWKLYNLLLDLIGQQKTTTVAFLFKLRGKILSMTSHYGAISSIEIDKIILQTMMSINTFYTGNYQTLLSCKIGISSDIYNFALKMLLFLLDPSSEKNILDGKNKLYFITDAGDLQGAGLLIFLETGNSQPTTKFSKKVHFSEKHRTIFGTSSSSREQHILWEFLKETKHLATSIITKHPDTSTFIVGDNQPVMRRLTTGRTKKESELIELQEIIDFLNTLCPQWSSRWTRRTNPLISFVDKLPRKNLGSFKLPVDLYAKIRRKFKIATLTEKFHQNQLRYFSQRTFCPTLKTTPENPFLVVFNPRTITARQTYNCILFFIVNKIHAVLVCPKTKDLDLILSETDNFQFTYTNFKSENKADTNWLQEKVNITWCNSVFR